VRRARCTQVQSKQDGVQVFAMRCKRTVYCHCASVSRRRHIAMLKA
jgi:hypothetical protein